MRFSAGLFRKTMYLWLIGPIAVCLLAWGMPNLATAAPAGFDQAVASFKGKQYSQALRQFQAVAQANPRDSSSRYYMGLCCQYMNQLAEAKRHYEWVATYGDVRLKGMAQTGLDQVSRYQSNRGYAGQGNVTSQASSPAAPTGGAARGAVKKILYFYTGWCGVCKKFDPTWTDTQSRFRSIQFVKLDAEDTGNEKLVKQYGVKAYPTLVYLSGSGQVLSNSSGAPMGENFAKTIESIGP